MNFYTGDEMHVEHSWNTRTYRVFLFVRVGDAVHVRQPDGTIHAIKAGERTDHLKPTFEIPEHVASGLVTALTAVGVRPKEQSRIEGQFEAQSKHLEDLRGILKMKRVLPK